MKVKLNNYWHLLSIPFMLFTVWLWSFPMYGPLLAVSGEKITVVFLLFLFSHSLGVLSYGFIMDYFYKKNKINYNIELRWILLFSFLLLFLTIIFPYLAPSFFMLLIILIGFLSGSLVVFYLYYISVTTAVDSRGRVLAFIFFLAGLFSIVFLLLPFNNWMFIFNGLFLLAPFLLISRPIKYNQVETSLKFSETNNMYWISLVLLVIMFYTGGGLMYNLLYADIISNSKISFDIGFLFYPIIVLPAGYFADRKGRITLISIGLCFSGLGFLLLFIVDTLNSLSLVLLQSGFALMDLFLLLTLMDWTDFFTNRKFIGIGLFLNVITIFISSIPFLGKSISNLINIRYWPIIGLTLVILIIPLLNFIKETRTKIIDNSPIEFEELCNKFSISPREKEVISLLLEGKDTGTITGLLNISYNTLKTHLKNIYRKTDTSSQTELILFIFKNTIN